MNNYFVSEWGHLYFNEDAKLENTIKPDDAYRLCATAEKLPISERVANGILTLHSNRISARGVVGVIQAGTCSLEILPKIDRVNSVDSNILETRKKLIEMLAVVYKLNFDTGDISSMDWQRNTILEILIGMFAQKLSDAVRLGLPQNYIDCDGDLPILKGSLNIVRQFTVNVANPSILSCQFDEFSMDIPINQVMKSAVQMLIDISQNRNNQNTLRKLNLDFSEVTYKVPNDLNWEAISIDSTNHQWKLLYDLAKLLHLQQFQTTTTGSIEGYSLLFEMNKLFEEYVSIQIQKVAARLGKIYSGLNVRLQKFGEHCLKDKSSGDLKFQTRPDIVVEFEGKVVQVIDMKWKQLETNKSNIWSSVEKDDLYQMMAYAEVYQTPRVTLIYPHNSKLGTYGDIERIGLIRLQENRQLEIFSINLANKEMELSHLTKIITPDEKYI